MADIIDALLTSDEPSIRWKVRTKVLGEDPASKTVRRLQDDIRTSPRVTRLLDGQAAENRGTYVKWSGRHWVMITLADIGYPAGDPALEPIAAKVMKTWLAPRYFDEVVTTTRPKKQAVPLMDGRYRRCASQQGGALLAMVTLGLVPEDTERLAERLLHWQWPDGGWNCDQHPEARSSSVGETLLPMRGLAAYAAARCDKATQQAAHSAAEVFLTRRLLFHRTNGKPIRAAWSQLHYPSYWYYDVLSGAKGLMEAGRLDDERCQDGLDILESKRLPDGGWPAEARRWKTPGLTGNVELVDWGPVTGRRMNEWITADALAVLKAAGRLI